jgi:hypothetical protein
MLKSALIAVAVLAVAAPGLAAAKGAKKAAAAESVQGPAAPIPYAQLAEEDAKLNGGTKAAKPAKKHGTKKAATEAPAADASAPAK